MLQWHLAGESLEISASKDHFALMSMQCYEHGDGKLLVSQKEPKRTKNTALTGWLSALHFGTVRSIPGQGPKTKQHDIWASL